MSRGFEIVKESERKNFEEGTIAGKKRKVYHDITLPQRADVRSAGYDFFAPKDIDILPGHKLILWTDVKAYMGDDEVLELYPRSSMGIKKGLMLSNTVGVIDSSYYNNEGNDGNIGLPLLNTSGVAIKIKAGERIVQGIFKQYLVAENGNPEESEKGRTGGLGSTGK